MKKTCILSFVYICAAVFLLAGCAAQKSGYVKDPGTISYTGIQPPKALVVYDSWSGNTASVAQVIAEEMNCPAVAVDDVGSYVLKDYDLLVVGSPVHGGMPTGKISTFLSELATPRASAVFVTYGAPLFGPAMAECCLNIMEKNLHSTSIGRFRCHGFHHILRTYPKHPDNKDKASAVEFAKGLIILCSEN